MKKNFTIAILFITLSFILAGCGRTSAPEVNTAQLQNEAGDFQYTTIPWGTDRASTEAALGIPFDQGVANAASRQIYLATDAYTLMKLPATVYCEFDASGLCRISFRITPAEKDVQACWDVLTDALSSQYGSVDPVINSVDPADPLSFWSETCLWERSDSLRTTLRAMRFSINGGPPSIELTLSVDPTAKEQSNSQ
ncbi:MAG: hypothetical protein NC420_09640 [Eubacterium sp.]|nr:hypothetical protein [Eubacterium sp.]MCM1215268.1 hypothetical protein [Lachnospiraceae bacterium]MCM1240249.1 hypothetical protein [Lachnospiraceae bacterium]MCM1345248.1 hypothetical protein [Muribaculaceae bacterium]